MHKTTTWLAVGVVVIAAVAVYVWMALNGPDAPTTIVPPRQGVPRLEGEPESRAADSASPGPGATSGKTVHPLLEGAQDAVVVEGSDEVPSTIGPKLAEVIRAVVESGRRQGDPATLTIDYPLDGTIFPPEIVSPTFLWHEPAEAADTWLIDVTFADESDHIYVLSPGDPPPAGRIDPDCIAENNEIYQPTPYQASAKSWTPSGDLWTRIKRRSSGLGATVTILGFRAAEHPKALSRGRISMATSEDRVGAPIFYRDVPLAPSRTQKGVIKPLGDDAVTLITWRLRDLSKPDSRVLLTDVPTCTNCHSFSADGKTLGMDLDGPSGDKGAYVIVPTAKQIVVEEKDVISWNSFPDKTKGHNTIGFLSQISPDGQYVVTTLNEAMYVCNFLDYRFLQVFYPTRGILGYYSRESGQIRALPGADDPKYVHCDAVWSPDGGYLVFARAGARDHYPKDRRIPKRANDPAETQIRYDLYRIPFNGGQGGEPEPIAGASDNGMSNTFPKVSPDGKWIVFVKCRNGQLLRPDSKLWIVPASGGAARLMRCNTWRMNSWHSFSPNGRWMVFSSKGNTPYTQMFLTHLDDDGNDSPAVLIPNSTAANRAVNLPEFLNLPYDAIQRITMPAREYLRRGLRGVELAKKGMFDEAMAEFDAAVKMQPDYLEGHVDAAAVLLDKGMLDEAMVRLNKVLQLDPEQWHAHCNLGVILARKGRLDEAIAHYETALELNPNYSDARAAMGSTFMAKGMLEEATFHFQQAVNLDPFNPLNYCDLGNVLLQRGMPDGAVKQFTRALEINPQFVDARIMLANALTAQGAFRPAVTQLQRALAIRPNDLRAVNDLAWLLAVCPSDDVRGGAGALGLIEPACQATGYRDPVLLSTLAAAYAEVGRFAEAAAIATKSLGLLKPEDKALAQTIRQHLECYQDERPCRLTPN